MLIGLGWVACVVAANGFVSLATDLEVVPLAAAGPLAEPLGVAVTALAISPRMARSTARSVALPIETALIAALALIVVPAAVALVMGGGGAAFLELGHGATSVFTLTDALLAALAGLVTLLVVRARAAGAGRPQWPWEHDDQP
ncbi:MAG: hypothetical protein HIU86_11695 [Acidobacteria bacterium]|nr:hypothetical protein [Acidobacteriota bacterium]